MTCDKYIETYLGDLNAEQLANIYEELGGSEESAEKFLCPDTGNILLSGLTPFGGYQFVFAVYLSDEIVEEAMVDTEAVKEKIDKSSSLASVAYITQYFDSETSMERGYNDYLITRWMQKALRFSPNRLN